LSGLLETSLNVEAICGRILAINMAEQALKLGNLLTTDIVLDLECGEMSPKLPFPFGLCVRS
jgi:hypothetical protein